MPDGNRYAAAMDPQSGPPQGAPPDMPPQGPPQGAPPDQQSGSAADTDDPNHPDVQKLWAHLKQYVLALQQQDPKHFQQLLKEHGVDPSVVAALLQTDTGAQGNPNGRDDSGRPAPHWLAR